MRILITGNKGQLGSTLPQLLQGHEVEGVDLPEVDISDRAQVAQVIAQFQPDVLINCAAYTNVDGCAKDPTLAYSANGLGAQNLALVCAEQNVELVQVSTNEVFAGTKPDGYFEWDTPCPINPYGNSKAAGEFFVRSLWRKHYIVRTAWLYAAGGRNFIHAILRFARERGAVRVVTDEVGNPTYVRDLAQAIAQLITTHQYGTYHFVNSGSCSRYEFANEILRLAGVDVPNTPIFGSEFKRASTPPPYCALNNTFGAALGITLRPWQEALAEFLQEVGEVSASKT